MYRDTLAIAFTDGVPELITSAYVAITRESPEILAEYLLYVPARCQCLFELGIQNE